ncbi:hypothetical protein BH23GEM9_BH23GEM9_05240 [soil metagenome]
MTCLMDEQTTPALRQVIGSLLRSATHADIAVMQIRLAAIDLGANEFSALRRCRILLGRLDAQELASLGAPGDSAQLHLHALHAFLTSGRAQIRSAGMAAWSPDFSVYRDAGIGSDSSGTGGAASISGHRSERVGRGACIVGAHYFHRPVVDDGPSLTCVMTDAPSVNLAHRRFDDLWDRAHDVHAAVVGAIERIMHVGSD